MVDHDRPALRADTLKSVLVAELGSGSNSERRQSLFWGSWRVEGPAFYVFIGSDGRWGAQGWYFL